jgi:hypothetical protein
MRYIVRYDRSTQRWLVVDTGVASQVIGIHTSEPAALEQASVEENRWVKFKPLYLATPTVGACA